MGTIQQDSANSDTLDDFFDPVMTDEDFIPVSPEKCHLAERRRRAELRLEQRRLREELGDDDFELDDF